MLDGVLASFRGQAPPPTAEPLAPSVAFSGGSIGSVTEESDAAPDAAAAPATASAPASAPAALPPATATAMVAAATPSPVPDAPASAPAADDLDNEVDWAANIGGFHDLVKALESQNFTSAVAERSDEKREEFKHDCEYLRHRMRSKRRGLIDPRAKKVQYWDMITTVALIFTATVTPFEVCLGIPTTVSALWFVNLVVNSIFMVDIVVQFFLPVYDTKKDELIRSHRELARRYCRSWFWLDLFTVLPFDILMLTVLKESDELCGAGATALLKGIKLLRTLRLFKLLRVLRASRIVQRWESSMSLSTNTRALITAIGGFCVLLHWLACLWALLPQLMPLLRQEEGLAAALAVRIEADASCTACLCDDDPSSAPCRNACLTPCEMEELSILRGVSVEFVRNSESWMCRAVARGYLHPDFETRYASTWLAALLVSMLQLVGGMGLIMPVNDAETALFIFALIVGSVVYAGVQGVVLRVLSTGNPEAMIFRQNLDALNWMMRDQNIPQADRVRVRDYFLKTKTLQKRESYFELIDQTMSRRLKGDLRYMISCKAFHSVWWLAQCEAAFLTALSTFVAREAFAKDDVIASLDEIGEARMCILDQGIASRAGTILTSGASWGDLLITAPTLRDLRVTKALGYCEVVTLTRAALDEALVHHPKSAELIRVAGLKLATQRAMIVISMYTQLHQRKIAERAAARKRQGAPAAAPAALSTISPSEILAKMTANNLLTNVAWREVGYEVVDGDRRVPVALHEGRGRRSPIRHRPAEDRSSSPSTTMPPALPLPLPNGAARPAAARPAQLRAASSNASPVPSPALSPVKSPTKSPIKAYVGGGAAMLGGATGRGGRASPTACALGGKAGAVSGQPAIRRAAPGAGGRGGAAAIAGLARNQAQSAQAIEQLSADMATLRMAVARMEAHLGTAQPDDEPLTDVLVA